MARIRQSPHSRAPTRQLANSASAEDHGSDQSEPETPGVVRPNQRPRPRRLQYGSPEPPTGRSELDHTPKFTVFSQLPAELRLKIWETYCPALTAPTRIIHLNFAKSWNMHSEDRQSFVEPGWLGKGFPLHRESRLFALNVVPNTLYFSYAVPRPGAGRSPSCFGPNKQQKDFQTGALHYNAHRDIIDLDAGVVHFSDILELEELAKESFAKEVQNVSLSLEGFDDTQDISLLAIEAAEVLRLTFPSLRNTFYMSTMRPGYWVRDVPLEIKVNDDFELEESMAWMKLPNCRKVTYKLYDLEVWHCPNFDNREATAILQNTNDTLKAFKDATEDKGIRFWPLVMFDYDRFRDQATKDAYGHDLDLDYADMLGMINHDRAPDTGSASSAQAPVEIATAVEFE